MARGRVLSAAASVEAVLAPMIESYLVVGESTEKLLNGCLLYTSDAADE